jgi:hypothetical protein
MVTSIGVPHLDGEDPWTERRTLMMWIRVGEQTGTTA